MEHKQAAPKVEMKKVRILTHVGAYQPGQTVELPADQADQLLMGGRRARLEEDQLKLDAAIKDPANMTVAEQIQAGVRNVAGPVDNHITAESDRLALMGKPVETADTITTTGGVTPPTTVHPEFAKAQGMVTTPVDEVVTDDVKKKQEDESEREQKAAGVKPAVNGKPGLKGAKKDEDKK